MKMIKSRIRSKSRMGIGTRERSLEIYFCSECQEEGIAQVAAGVDDVL